jgi:hypothetical protein
LASFFYMLAKIFKSQFFESEEKNKYENSGEAACLNFGAPYVGHIRVMRGCDIFYEDSGCCEANYPGNKALEADKKIPYQAANALFAFKQRSSSQINRQKQGAKQ